MDHVELKPLPVEPQKRDYEFVVHTFGCKVNTYDTGLIQKNLQTNGFTVTTEKKNNAIHVLNTCAVTGEATQQAVRLARKIKSKEPLATVVVTGCAAQVDTQTFENLSGVDLVVANSHKGLLPQILDQYFKKQIDQKVFKSNIFRKDDLEADGGHEKSHTRSFLKIQDGCNSFCTFCIIPYARGKSRSIPMREIANKIKSLEQQDVKEVVLTGVHIGDYEDVVGTKKNQLEDLVEYVLKHTKIGRIRLSSLEPIELSDRLVELFKDTRLCPHFHMSIQSADTDVLANMKRKYTEQDVRNSLKKIKDQVSGAFVGMDVIAGFPTETEEQFENTIKVLSETPWTRLHVFPYSERQGTRAATLTQVTMMKRKERAQRLRELSLHRLQAEALKQVGLIKKILVLNKPAKSYDGVTQDYWNVKLSNNSQPLENFKNQEVEVKITSVQAEEGGTDVVLIGEFAL